MDLPYFKSHNYIKKYEVNNLCQLKKARSCDLCQLNITRAPLFISAEYGESTFTRTLNLRRTCEHTSFIPV